MGAIFFRENAEYANHNDGQPVCADLFCGPGSFSLAARGLGLGVAYAYEPDGDARLAYAANFNKEPHAHIGDGFTEDNTPPESVDLLFCRFPESTAEFDQVALRFLRFCAPRGAMFVSPPRRRNVARDTGEIVMEREAEDRRIASHMARRMSFLGYEVSDGLIAALSDEDGVVPHRALMGLQRHRGLSLEGREFPWPLVAEKTHVDRQKVPPQWQSVKPGLGGGWVEITTANAVVWAMARLALGAGYAE